MIRNDRLKAARQQSAEQAEQALLEDIDKARQAILDLIDQLR